VLTFRSKNREEEKGKHPVPQLEIGLPENIANPAAYTENKEA
jgi:hypothetical protein